MARIVLAEQSVASGFLTALGGSDEDLRALSLVILVGSVAGVIVSAVTVNVEKLVMPMMLAVTAIAAAAFVDSSATGLDHLPRFYLSQAAISFSAMCFLGPALGVRYHERTAERQPRTLEFHRPVWSNQFDRRSLRPGFVRDMSR
ncbi:hypothetical protein J2W42_006768 [Rhizobium tibeticum]|uniref:hypothetical protein n=1 Tax=Rhizobium tibeticum TaxID=501024 RepID=UPI002784BF11|nr:hypothetical protein [Rhizobium tibeticum]MDP9813891.1 hypothetical protein [Rhizobium tibeticum]